MHPVDHLLFLVIALVYPVSSYLSYLRLLRRIEAGAKVDRKQLYDATLIGHWALFAVTMAFWLTMGRDWGALGFGRGIDGYFPAGIVLCAAAIVLLIAQYRQVSAASDEELRTFRGQLGSVDILVPRNGNELNRFYGVSLTAGIVEETLWRGFLIWYLGQFMPLWLAASLSAVGFGVAHAYQGIDNLPRITLVGAVFTAIYLLTGSLWLPMVLHAAVDVIQGRLGYEVIHRTDFGAPETGGSHSA